MPNQSLAEDTLLRWTAKEGKINWTENNKQAGILLSHAYPHFFWKEAIAL